MWIVFFVSFVPICTKSCKKSDHKQNGRKEEKNAGWNFQGGFRATWKPVLERACTIQIQQFVSCKVPCSVHTTECGSPKLGAIRIYQCFSQSEIITDQGGWARLQTNWKKMLKVKLTRFSLHLCLCDSFVYRRREEEEKICLGFLFLKQCI